MAGAGGNAAHGAWGRSRIYFAQELRPYSFLLTMGIAACCLIIRISSAGRARGG